ncbi:hypothetical protein [Catellatospora sichuanensis]|uniref:hypothetical protein n=1 Tax=Catellatospora sichuanensis TaxID=1969805 RepID=UPI00118446D2|nr:hypothetical protein [Catellatospora sichuanensis]
MHGAELDGVAVTWQDLPGDVKASLVFGVGARDEDVDRIGLNHLVQMLVLEAVSTEADQSTSLLDTAFTASGTPAEVAEHLVECCAALAALPLDDLAEVAALADAGDRAISLDVEMDDPCRDPWGSLLARRLGAAGAGVLRWPPVDYTDFTADEVRAHVARYFSGGNAALALTRAPWPGLRLPLPAGERPDRPDPVAVRPGGGWYADEVVAPGIAVTAPAGPHAQLVLALLNRRVAAALDKAGLKCWQTPWYTPATAATVEIGLSLHFTQQRGRDSARVAAVLWEQLRSLAAQPAAPSELAEAVTWHGGDPLDLPDEVRRTVERLGLAEAVRDAATIGRVATVARLGLLGVFDGAGPAEVAAMAQLSPAEVRAAVASWLGTALVVVPVGTEVGLDGLARVGCPLGSYVPQGQVLRPSLWRRMRGTDEHLVLAADGIHQVRADGSVHGFPYADAMLVEQGEQVLLGNVRHGCLVDVTHLGDVAALAAGLPPRRLRRIAT